MAALMDPVRIARRLWVPAFEIRLHHRDPFGVALEAVVHRPARSGRATLPLRLRRHVVTPPPVEPIGVGDIAGRLFEVRHQAPPFEDLGQNVRDVFAGDVRAAELRDRVVAVLAEDAGVELFCTRHAASPPELTALLTPGSATLSANSSRNSRRSDFAEREYRANSAPFTVSGRLVSAKM